MLLCTTSAHKLETVYDRKFFKMTTKESCGKVYQKKRTTASTFDKKPDDTDILYYNTERKQGLKRLNVEVDTPRKRPKLSSSTDVASYSNNNQITSQRCTSNEIEDTKLKANKLTNTGSKPDYEIKKHSNIKITKGVKSKPEGQTMDKNWSHSLLQKKMKELKEKNKKDKDSSEELEKCKKDQLPQNYNFNNIKEPFQSGRKKISFKIPKKSSSTLQKPVEENVFNVDSSKSKIKQEIKECLHSYQMSLSPATHKTENLFSGSAHKQTVCEGKRKYHCEHQEMNGSYSKENCIQSFETPCSSVSSENIQDTDEEMQIVEELHAARVGKSVDLPVVPPSGELMSMEIDLVEDDVHSSAASTASDKKLLIVIDTNILMNHLKFVKILKTTEIPDFETLVLIIPWVVMQELDRMKAGKLLKHVQHKAVPAIHFINDSLRNQDRKLWGQPLQLASQKLYELSDENNDDRVLKCCLQYQELFPCSLVILCTDDRNLRSKSIISGVKSLSKEELDAEILNLTLNTDICLQPGMSKPQLKAVTPEANEESTNSRLSILLQPIINDLEKYLGTALSSILETEMKIAFGNLWMEVLYLKPPWTLINLLQCFKKHWLAVFGLVMENKLLLTIESLYENLSTVGNNSVDFATVKFLLQDSKSLLRAFSTRSNYDGILPHTFAQVNRLLQVLAEVKTKFKPSSSESTVSKKQEDTSLMNLHNQEVTVFLDSPVHQLPQFTRHQEIWSVLENVWTSIYQNSTDVFQKLDSSSTLTTSKLASFREAFAYLQKLMAAVKDILEGIQRILAPNSSYQDVEMLYNFLIKYEVNKNVKFTAQELYDCVSQTEYREKLTIGCRQLIEMEYTMQQCSASVYMEAKNRGWCENMLNKT